MRLIGRRIVWGLPISRSDRQKQQEEAIINIRSNKVVQEVGRIYNLDEISTDNWRIYEKIWLWNVSNFLCDFSCV